MLTGMPLIVEEGDRAAAAVDRVALAIARADASVALPSETMSTPVSTAYGRDLSKKMGEAVMAKTRRREEAAFLSAVMKTAPMAYCHQYLAKKGKLSPAQRSAFRKLLSEKSPLENTPLCGSAAAHLVGMSSISEQYMLLCHFRCC